MINAACLSPLNCAISSIQRCDRWSIHHRLQELNVTCACPADGSLRVAVDNVADLVLAHSAIRQFITSRQDQADWLDRCWHTQVLCPADH